MTSYLPFLSGTATVAGALVGLQPGGGLDYGAVILGTVGLTSSCGLAGGYDGHAPVRI